MTHVMLDARAPRRAGWARHNRRLLDALLHQGHQVTAVVCPWDTLPETVQRAEVATGVDAFGRSEAFCVMGWPALVEQHKPQLVLGAAGVLPLGRCSARRVVLLNDVGFERLGVLERAALRVRLAAAVAAAQRVVVPSRWLADEVRLMHPHARLEVIAPLMTPEDTQRTRSRATLNALGLLPGQYFCVPFTAQAQGCLGLIMEAFAGVPMELDPQLVLMSSEKDWNPQAHVDFLDDDHKDAVFFTDELDEPTRLEVLHHAAALVHPCTHDGALLEALEAHALGTHVITSQSPAATELLGRQATQVDHTDVDAWMTALTQALERPPKRNKYKDNGAAKAWNGLVSSGAA